MSDRIDSIIHNVERVGKPLARNRSFESLKAKIEQFFCKSNWIDKNTISGNIHIVKVDHYGNGEILEEEPKRQLLLVW